MFFKYFFALLIALNLSHAYAEDKENYLKNQTTINIALNESAESLDEVVVIGYGTQKKSDVTGAIGQVKGDDLIGELKNNKFPFLSFNLSIAF